jgi:Predicted Zn peptidase
VLFSPSDFKAPYISQPQVWQMADDFRVKFWKGTLPVNVMAIVEFDLNLDIVPMSSLRQDADIDALLLDDWQTIVVDQGFYMDDRYQNRIRFSMAHELGHFVMHKPVFEAIPRSSAEEWLAFVRDMPEREYSFLESQAYEFAGRFLVPPKELRQELEAAVEQAEAGGLARNQLREDSHMQYLAKPIARRFEVSSNVIEKRLLKESLWPLA